MIELPLVRPLLLWDGDCNFCRRCAAWCKQQDATHRFDALPFQQCPSPPMTPALYEACHHAVHVLFPEGEPLRAGRAVLYLLGQVGFTRTASVLRRIPFIWAIELGYAIVARHRMFFSKFLFTRERP